VKCPKCGETFEATASANAAPPPAASVPPPRSPEPPRVLPAPPASTPVSAPPLAAPAPPPTLPAPAPRPAPPAVVPVAPAPLVVTCTHCQTRAKVAAEFAGRQVKCPSCQQIYVAAGVPLPAEPPLARVVDNAPELRDRYSPESRRDEWDRRPLRNDSRRDDDYPPRRRRYDDEYPPRGRYDDDDYGSSRPPEPMPRKLPGGDWTLVVVFLMVAVLIGDVLGIWVLFDTMNQLAGLMVTMERTAIHVVIAVIRFVVGVILIIFFCIWIHRAFSNLKYFRVRGLNYTPGWAVGCWFVPFVNFVWPLMAVQELWKASHPRASGRDWKDTSVSALAIVWWLLFCATYVVGIVGGVMHAVASAAIRRPGFNPQRWVEQVKAATYVELASTIMWMMTGLLLIFLVLGIRKRQEQKLENFMTETGDAGPDGPRGYDDDRDR
jgi:hypothetical protein